MDGNRIAATTPHLSVTSTQTAYDHQDRLTNYGNFTYTYTNNGELKTKTDTSVTPSRVTTYAYDSLGNLLSVTPPTGSAISYIIDGMNRRVAKKVGTTITKQWLYRDGLRPVAELDGTGALVSTFLYASNSNVPDYMIRGGNTYRIITDQVGSVRLVVNVNNVADVPFSATYTAFGDVTITAASPDFLPFGFAGGMYDVDTGLVRFGARDYDPVLGRWISKDPVRFGGRQANLYVYVNDDPVNGQDPTGTYASTTSCSYYDERCAQNGGSYYCEDAPTWCNRFGDNPWSDCTRACLQNCDADHNPDRSNSSPNYDDANGECVQSDHEQPDNSGPWDPRSKDFDCHAVCYSACWGLLATGGL
ncbi:MAG TPA: RHS repeat-associated core domain-containing protein [Polyangiaceae bacterium]|nr:RHS repeat-associated core domain-containing protein [Polyangiaceae bacterium]